MALVLGHGLIICYPSLVGPFMYAFESGEGKKHK